jgi:acyl-CoA reductase-like NAD-dependent aldehyde dehydrogenase
MCTAPQNIFIPETGIDTGDGHLSYEETVKALSEAITGLANHPKMGAGTLGGIQAEATLSRAQQAAGLGGKMLLNTERIANPEFENARVSSPALIELNSSQKDVFQSECFGPVVFVIKTKDVNEAIELMKTLALEKGAITCSAYTVDTEVMQKVEETMNRAFTPVSFNFTGAIFVNQHAAFSDFHVTGGNPAGNASFTNPDYINRRFVWVGNRFIA